MINIVSGKNFFFWITNRQRKLQNCNSKQKTKKLFFSRNFRKKNQKNKNSLLFFCWPQSIFENKIHDRILVIRNENGHFVTFIVV